MNRLPCEIGAFISDSKANDPSLSLRGCRDKVLKKFRRAVSLNTIHEYWYQDGHTKTKPTTLAAREKIRRKHHHMKLTGVTIWAEPHGEHFHSQYGVVDYKRWCEKEIERLKAEGIAATISTDKHTGRICLSIVDG